MAWNVIDWIHHGRIWIGQEVDPDHGWPDDMGQVGPTVGRNHQGRVPLQVASVCLQQPGQEFEERRLNGSLAEVGVQDDGRSTLARYPL